MTFKLTIALPNITSLILGLLSIKHASYFCTEEFKLENVDVGFFVFFSLHKGSKQKHTVEIVRIQTDTPYCRHCQ